MRALILIVTLVALGSPSIASAWSGFVHQMICEQAYERLSPTAREMVDQLTQGEVQPEGYDGFGQACVWPDEVRKTTHKATYQYHFINVPRGSQLDMQRDCAAHDCASQAVKRYALYLSDTSRSPRQRAEALRFLGHFVADLHQPLHVGYREDRGGNDINVLWRDDEEPIRLHWLWDGRLAEDMGLTEAGGVQRLVRSLQPKLVEHWSNLAVDRWAHESFRLARDSAYKNVHGMMLKNEAHLGQDYYRRAAPIVRKRVLQAVVRLGYLLEKAASGDIAPGTL